MKISIIGVGLIGGSLGLCLKHKLGDEIFISGLCKSQKSMDTAIKLNAVDFVSGDIAEVVNNSDIVYLSTPVLQIVPMVKKILPHLKPHTILTDAGSTKGFINEELKKILPNDIYYVPGHPMTGRELSGVEAAKSDLFKGKAYVIVNDVAPSEAYDKLMSILKLTEAKFVSLDIAKHDRCASIISHVPHLTAAALVTLLNRAGDDLPSCLKLIGGGFNDTTRIASSNADMWADICMTNSKAITANLKDMQLIFDELINAIEKGNRQAIFDFFVASKSRRDSILESIHFDPN